MEKITVFIDEETLTAEELKNIEEGGQENEQTEEP